MRSLIALIALGCVAAGSIQTYGWSPSQEYRYTYSSQVLTGIPELNNQYSGVRLTAQVRIQPRRDSTCRIQLEQPRFVTYNEVIEFRGEHISSEGRQEEIPSHLKTWLEKPFTVFHKRGLVEKLETENGEPEFIVNLKKALTSQLQQDLSKAESVRGQNQVQSVRSEEVLPVFTSHEASIMGKCETEYTISMLPEYLVREFEEREGEEESSKVCEGKEYYQIIKSKNLDRCTERPIYHESYGIWSKNDGSESSSLPSQSSLTKTIICGSLNDHVIRKVVTENRIISSAAGRFESNEKLEVSSVSTLKLETVEERKEEISGPSSPKEYASLVYEYPSGSTTSSRSLKQEQIQQQQQQQQQQQWQGAQLESHAPVPDMTSAPKHVIPRTESERELKQMVVEIFTEIVEESEKMSESSTEEKDVAGLSILATRIMSQLSYEALKEVERTIEGQHSMKYESTVEKAFFDLVSMTATNPCMKLIKDKVESGDMIREPTSWSWILSNALRSVKTPTEELLGELVELLKTEHIQRNRVIRAAYAMGLTELVHKACINQESMEKEFPYRFYGQLCHESMPVIKDNLIPYLTRKLQESTQVDMGSVITYVNALGNIGTEESSKELLKVVEGRISTSPHPRSVAVYKLIRPARENPSVYRPVFQSLIENSAENVEVRMAAVTALTYCYPSTADFQRLAIRTWFEPSRQMSTYIYSTLKTLSQLTGSLPEYDAIKMKAEITLPLAKPSIEGIQNSRNLQVTQFIESIRTAVSHKLQYTSTEESVYPRSIHAKASMQGLSSDVDALETTFYIQGAEYVIDKLYEMYSTLKDQGKGPQPEVSSSWREVQDKMRKLNIRDMDYEEPEAHVTMKFFGLQKLYSFDEKYVSEIVRKITSDIARNQAELARGMNFEYFKILDLMGSRYSFPTESGMPIFMKSRTPTVSYANTEVKSEWQSTTQPKLELVMKVVSNYKRHVSAGVFSPITEKFHGAGVDTSMHIALPFESEITYRNGQVQVTLKETKEPEYQREQPLVQFDVHPYTTAHSLSKPKSIVRGQEVKTINSRHAEKQVIWL